jgi:hypothetical protein
VVGSNVTLGNGPPLDVLFIVLADRSGVCGILQGNTNPASTTALLAVVANYAGMAVGPGTYDMLPLNGGDGGQSLPLAAGLFSKSDAQCNSVVTDGGESPNATGGTVTVSSGTSSSVSGTFNMTFASGSLSGSFNVPVCSGVDPNALFRGNSNTCG